MKKILLSLILLSSFLFGVSQRPVVTVPRSSPSVTVKDAAVHFMYNMGLPRYADTTAANLSINIGADSCGTLIYTYSGNKIWKRSCSPKRWEEAGILPTAGSGIDITGPVVSNIGRFGKAGEDFRSTTGARRFSSATNKFTFDSLASGVGDTSLVLRGTGGATAFFMASPPNRNFVNPETNRGAFTLDIRNLSELGLIVKMMDYGVASSDFYNYYDSAAIGGPQPGYTSASQAITVGVKNSNEHLTLQLQTGFRRSVYGDSAHSILFNGRNLDIANYGPSNFNIRFGRWNNGFNTEAARFVFTPAKTGYLGIGVTNPTYRLHVDDSAKLSGISFNRRDAFGGPTIATAEYLTIYNHGVNSQTRNLTQFLGTTPDIPVEIRFAGGSTGTSMSQGTGIINGFNDDQPGQLNSPLRIITSGFNAISSHKGGNIEFIPGTMYVGPTKDYSFTQYTGDSVKIKLNTDPAYRPYFHVRGRQHLTDSLKLDNIAYYTSNLHGKFAGHTLIDKDYLDSIVGTIGGSTPTWAQTLATTGGSALTANVSISGSYYFLENKGNGGNNNQRYMDSTRVYMFADRDAGTAQSSSMVSVGTDGAGVDHVSLYSYINGSGNSALMQRIAPDSIRLGSALNISDLSGFSQTKVLLKILPNNFYVKNLPSSIDTSANKPIGYDPLSGEFFRMNSWAQVSGGSPIPTWQTVLNAGSTLTGTNIISTGTLSDVFSLTFDGGGRINLGQSSTFLSGPSNSSITLQSSGTILAGKTDVITLGDSTFLRPYLGRLSIDTLRTATTQPNILLWGGLGNSTVAALGIGTEGDVLTVVSGIPAWAAPSGGGGAVSSVTGTANQITASPTTGAVTLSIPSVFSAPGTVTAATGLTVTSGGATITAGGLTVTAGGLTVTAGTITLTPLSTIGIVFNSAAGVLSTYSATDHALQIGDAVGQIASLGLGTAGQVLTSNGAGADPSWQAGGGGSSTWNGITDPTGSQALTHGAGELTVWTDQNTTGNLFTINNSVLTSGKVININVTGTAGLTNQTGLAISLSGANATGAQTTYGLDVSNTHSGTSVNVAARFTATGGSSNIALIAAGRIGAGGVTNPFSDIDNGNGSLATGSLAVTPSAQPATSGNLWTGNGGSLTNTTNAAYQYLSSTNSGIRVAISGIGTGAITVGAVYGTVVIGAATTTEAASGTHPLISSLAIKAPSITGAAATVTNQYTVYIESAPTGTANNTGSLWVDAGIARFDESITVSTASATALTVGGALTPSAGSSGFISNLGGAITEAGSGTHSILAGTAVLTPIITGGSATVTSATGLYVSGNASASGANNSAAWIAGTLRLGDAGTTAGIIKMEGVTSGIATIAVPAAAGTPTLTLPTVTGTIVQYAEASITSSATPTPTGDARENFLDITALATNPTFAAPSGTASNHNMITIRITDSGGPRTLAWNAIYRGGVDIALPTVTTSGLTMYIQFMYNATDNKFDIVGLSDGY